MARKKSTKIKHLRDYEVRRPRPGAAYEVLEVEGRNLCSARGGVTVAKVADATCDRCRDNEEARYLQAARERDARNASAGLGDDLDGADPDVVGSTTPEAGDEKGVREEYEEAQRDLAERTVELTEVVSDCDWWREVYDDPRLADVWGRYRVTAQELEREVLATDKAADLVELRANVRARRALHEALGDPFGPRRTQAQQAYDTARERVERIEQAYPLLVGGQDVADLED